MSSWLGTAGIGVARIVIMAWFGKVWPDLSMSSRLGLARLDLGTARNIVMAWSDAAWSGLVIMA